MDIKQFDYYHRRRPFRPFRAFLTDGRSFLIEQPEYVARSPRGTSVAMYNIEDDIIEHIDFDRVTGLKEMPEQQPDVGKRRPTGYPRPEAGGPE